MAEKGPTNGWRSGTDPIQRWLRVVTTVVVLAVFVYVAVGDSRNDSLVVLALALGSVLLLLGYEGVVRLPFIDAKDIDLPFVGKKAADKDDGKDE